jgi:phage terminase small subunit
MSGAVMAWDDELTEKERAFVSCYVETFNSFKAAINSGSTETSAYVTGSRMLRKTKIQQAIRAFQDEMSIHLTP